MSNIHEEQLLTLIRQYQYISVDALSKELFLSPSSIRRHLDSLKKKGLIQRTHGGAKIQNESTSCPSFSYRTHQNIFAKKKIAEAAAQLVHDGDVIFLDGSSSGFFLAEFLTKKKNIRVITNGLDTISQLNRYHIPAASTGGLILNEDPSLLVGKIARKSVADFHANIAFFSTSAITEAGEIFDVFEDGNEVIQTMLRHSDYRVMLCDSSKFGKSSPYRLGSLSDVDKLITDQKPERLDPRFSEKIEVISKKETLL